MAIEKMSKFRLYVFDRDRKPLLKDLQKFKDVHFVDVKGSDDIQLEVPDVSVDERENTELISKAHWMLQTLEPYEDRPGALKALKEGIPSYSMSQVQEAINYEWEKPYEELTAISETVEQKKLKIAELETDIKDLEPLKSVNIDIGLLGKGESFGSFWGTVPKRDIETFEEDVKNNEDVYLEKLSETKAEVYFQAVFLRANREAAEAFLRQSGFQVQNFSGEGTPANLIVEKEEKIQELKEEKVKGIEQIKKFLPELNGIRLFYEALENQRIRLQAQENFAKTDQISILEGYILTDEESEFKHTVEKVSGEAYFLEIEDAERDSEEIPIRLKNNKFVSSFEALTEMFVLPRYNEIDPTPLLAPFYWFFFGMMGADVGYGLIVLALTTVALKFFNLKESMRKFVRFFFYLSFAVIGWGFVYGSFFGGAVELPTPTLIDTNSEFILMLIMSISFGLVHIFFGMGVALYMNIRDGEYLDALYDVIFWYMALVGAIMWPLAGALGFGSGVATVAKWVMIAGMVGIVLTGGRESESIGGRLGSGLFELYGITGYIGDFVSYSRLMALGLSSGFIGFAINMITNMLIDGGGIIGYIFGFIVFIGFHLFNVFLSMLSAYVHTARLTYVEFFGKFYEGGGVRFKEFLAQPKYIEIKSQEVIK